MRGLTSDPAPKIDAPAGVGGLGRGRTQAQMVERLLEITRRAKASTRGGTLAEAPWRVTDRSPAIPRARTEISAERAARRRHERGSDAPTATSY